MKLNVFQIERLCSIVYLDPLLNNYKNSLSYIMTYLLEVGFAEMEETSELPALMTREDWNEVARSIAADPQLGKLIIVDFINDISGHRAFCFMENRTADSAYVVFRGTSSDAEWLDNALGMTTAETPAQKAALGFVIKTRAIPSVNFLCVAGHSKGGNKAMYCAIKGSGIVDKCISVDGQGFSRLFFDKYNGIIEKNRFKVTSIAERRDFVNCLGFYLKQPLFYAGRRGDRCSEYPYGNPLPYFHCPDALRLKTGEPGKEESISHVSIVVNSFVVYFLSEEKYASKREKTALGLVSLMTEDSGKQSADAIAEAALCFFELAAASSDFRTKLQNLLRNEKDLIAATALMIRENHRNSGKIADTAMSRIAEKLLRSPVYFGFFLRNAERFMLFSHRTRELKEYAEHINHFIKGIFGHIEKQKINTHTL
jgi:hypothetical protein